MGFYKDALLRELEVQQELLEALGVPSDVAYQMAGDRAYRKLRESLADQADWLRQQRKDEGLQ